MTDMPTHPQQSGEAVSGHPGELLDRFLARLIDGVLLGIAYSILSAIFSPIFRRGLVYSTGEIFLYSLFLSISFVAVAIGYFAYLESTRGQTLGKMLMRLEVHGPDGSLPTMEQAVRRNAFYAIQLITIIPFVGWVIGPLASLTVVILIAVSINNDPDRRQGYHDQFAGGTYVLKRG